MRIQTLFVALLIVVPQFVAAEEIPVAPKAAKKHLSVSERETTNDAPCSDGAYLENLQCMDRMLSAKEEELATAYERALAKLPEKNAYDARKERAQLVMAQKAWLSYRDENCALLGGQRGGSNFWVTYESIRCMLDATAERMKVLDSIGARNAP